MMENMIDINEEQKQALLREIVDFIVLILEREYA